jgi:hypothetical protein
MNVRIHKAGDEKIREALRASFNPLDAVTGEKDGARIYLSEMNIDNIPFHSGHSVHHLRADRDSLRI